MQIPRNAAERQERIELDFEQDCVQETPCPAECQYEDDCRDAWTEALRAERFDNSEDIETEVPF